MTSKWKSSSSSSIGRFDPRREAPKGFELAQEIRASLSLVAPNAMNMDKVWVLFQVLIFNF